MASPSDTVVESERQPVYNRQRADVKQRSQGRTID